MTSEQRKEREPPPQYNLTSWCVIEHQIIQRQPPSERLSASMMALKVRFLSSDVSLTSGLPSAGCFSTGLLPGLGGCRCVEFRGDPHGQGAVCYFKFPCQ